MKKITFFFVMALALTLTSYAQPGAIDPSFSSYSSANGTVNSTLTLPDGKIIIVGAFTNVNGTTSNRIARLNSDGSKDLSFTVSLATGAARAIQLQSNGKIIVAGDFTTVNGLPVPARIIRLNADGTFDNSFNAGGAGADAAIVSIAIDGNDRILIGGAFVSYNGVSRNRIARLNANGMLDLTFLVGTGASATVNVVAIQPADAKILIGGNLVSYNGISRSRIARLNTDGTLDAGFVPMTANAQVRTIAIQTDGKIIYGGDFTNYAADVTKKYLVRANSDGTHDATYNSYGFNGPIRTIELDANGKLLVGGAYTFYNATAKNNIARLKADASLDNSINSTGANAAVETTSIQADGKILIGGSFTTFNGVSQIRLVRISGYYSSQLSPAFCGATLPSLNTTITADWVAGAQEYRFRITKVDMNTNAPIGAPIVVERPANTIALSNVPGVTYNSKYRIEVAVKRDNIKEPFYGPACYVTTPNPVSTIGAQCGTTLNSMTQYVYATYVASITGYRFRITNTTDNSVQVFDSASNRFFFNQLPNKSFGTTYFVEVALKNTDGTYLPYNVGCNITTPAFPTTQIQASQCESVATSNTQNIYADIVSGASDYRFMLSRAFTPTYSSTIERTLNSFTLSMFTGLAAGTTYDVQVAVRINGVWGPYGAVCHITTPGGFLAAKEISSAAAGFTAVAYPNPFVGDFKLNITTTSDSTISIKVYDMLGKQVENKSVELGAIENLQVGGNYTSGVYNVIVSQGGNTQTLRIIKR